MLLNLAPSVLPNKGGRDRGEWRERERERERLPLHFSVHLHLEPTENPELQEYNISHSFIQPDGNASDLIYCFHLLSYA